MPYYDTIDEDLARAKEILEKGKAEQLDFDRGGPAVPPLQGGTIFGADTFAAYKLLESFVEVIDTITPGVCRQMLLAIAEGKRQLHDEITRLKKEAEPIKRHFVYRDPETGEEIKP